jgi:copper(I)-binding protein
MHRFALACLLCLESYAAVAAPVQVVDPWIAAAPPGQPVLAAYMRIENMGTDSVCITGWQSEQFERVELHQSLVEEGMARMRALPRFTIDAHAAIELQPGGMHLMLIRPHQDLKPGDRVSIQLQFESGSSQTIEPEVRYPAQTHHHDHLTH